MSFPPEIIYQILLQLPSEEVLKFAPIFGFHDWEFWRHKATIDFQLPKDYFDLALPRKISGRYRYFEIATKFKSSIISLAVLDKDLITGFYEAPTLLALAIDDNNLNLIKQLLPLIPKKVVKQIYHQKLVKGTNKEVVNVKKYPPVSIELIPTNWQSIIGYFDSFILLINHLYRLNSSIKDFFDVPEEFVLIERKEWGRLETKMVNSFRYLESNYRVIINLIHSQDPQAFSVAQIYILGLNPKHKEVCLRVALERGNKYQVGWILQFLPEVISGHGSKENYTNSILSSYNNNYFYETVEYNLLFDAYCGANLELIEQFESYGYQLNLKDTRILSFVCSAIQTGYQKKLSNPIDVYNLLKSRPKLRESVHFINDIDILGLQKQTIPKFIFYLLEGIIPYEKKGPKQRLIVDFL